MNHRYKLILLAWAFAGFFGLVLDRVFLESMLVPSSSMRPTLLPNERMWLKKFRFRPLTRFDVVVIDSPSLGHRIVKRVIGLPGECVELRDSFRVRIGSGELSYFDTPEKNILRELNPLTGESHLIQLEKNPKYDFPTQYGKTPLCLGSDEYYVLGDNRLASLDSRVFGVVKADRIQGIMTWIWYSYDKLAHRLRTERLGFKVKE